MSAGHDGERRVSAWFAPVVPPPRFARNVPAGRWPSVRSRGGQPDPSPPTAAVPVVAPPRWVGCPDDRQLHLLSPVGVAAAAGEGFAHAWCGRRIPAAGLTLTGHSAGLCVSCCLAAGMGP
ncbi:MAG: hypothetical protein ACRDRA_20580 [Pseudonocardiaceae bacterium]